MIKKTVDGDKTEYTYNDKGLLTEVKDNSGTVKYPAGRVRSFDNGFGKTTYEYDVLDRVTKVIDRNGRATLYEYDSLGNRSAVRYPNGNVVTYEYDACNRLKEECITNASGVQLSKYSYGIGKAGERTSVTEINSGVETDITYKYDKLNRLTKETVERNGNKLTYEYSYDAVSNRTEKKVTVKGDISELADTDIEEIELTEGKTTYTYNALNQLITEETPNGAKVYTYDANGNLVRQTGDKTVDYSYDKENHLVKATIQKGNSVTIKSYTYDNEGMRKIINNNYMDMEEMIVI